MAASHHLGERLRKQLLVSLLLASSIALGGWRPASASQQEKAEAKHHHDLRGVISKVEPDKNRFEIRTDAGRVVLCLIDEETTIKRGSEKIELEEVTRGQRAYCHCAALRNGRHYSTSLLVEQKEKEEE